MQRTLNAFFNVIGGLALLTAAQVVCAEGPTQIGLVDMQRLVNESIIGKAARSNLEAETKKRQAALAPQQAELEKLKDELKKQSAVLSPAAVEERSAAYEKAQRDFERAVQDQRDELKRRNSAEVGKVVEQVDQVITELAAKSKFKFILENDSRLVIYADAKLDITDEVIKLLDRKKIGM